MRKRYLLLISVFLVGSGYPENSALMQSATTAANPLLVSWNQLNDFAVLQADHIPEATRATLASAQALLDSILTVPAEQRTFRNTVLAIDDIYALIGRVEDPIYLMGAVHPDEAIREAADSSIIRFERWLTDFGLNENLYRAVATYAESAEASSLTGVEKRLLDDILKDFRRQGLGLPPEKKEKVRALKNRISELGLEFNNNIAQYTDTLVVTEADMEGLPEAYKKAHYAGDGRYKIDISYPSRRPFMRLSKSEAARKALSEKFLNRAADKNLQVIPQMVAARQELAHLLGYRSYAEYILEDRMPKNPETVWQFEADLQQAIREKADRELQELLALKSKLTGTEANEINYWELHYLENLLAEEKYQLNDEEISEYFELNQVRDGLFTIAQRVFGLHFETVDSPRVWHPEVTLYAVYDSASDTLMGYFYLDLFPRENKYSHAAHFGIAKGKLTPHGYQKPIAALVCNFPRPTPEQPSLLRHTTEVETFFHEFGHLIHGMVTTAKYYYYSGTGVDRDFVEAPSQLFENWVWEKESLRLFARHYRTGEVIPDSLLERMLAAKNMSAGGDMAFQVFLGLEDMTLYDRWDPNGPETVLDVARRLHREILNWNETPNTARIASFGHLNGYAASYYGYAWSEVFAQDMFSVFQEEGILNPETGRRFRTVVLAPGGSQEAMDLIRTFLGREPNNQAFIKSLGL
jgi:thimet oligopeptidase